MATDSATAEDARGLARVLPFMRWAPSYQRQWLRPDLVAGLTVAALVVPKSLGGQDAKAS